MTRNNAKARAAFKAHKAAIDKMLTRLQALSAEDFKVDPTKTHWGHVGDLENIAQKLREISDQTFKEGEFAHTYAR